jgi:prophage antirepressor-like protein
MEVVKAFNSNKLHTEIVIKGTINEPLFRANDVGTILEMTNIRATIQNFDDSEKVVNSIDTLGGSQQVTFLTEKGLYKVLFKSRKPIAEKFQNWVCEVIKELRLNGVYDLQKQLSQVEDKKKQEYETKLEKQKVIEREKILLKEYGTIGSVFYVIKVKTYENKQYVIKVGESRRGITDRYKEHKSKYEECLLLDCFTVNKSKDFETFIKEHDLIRPNKVKTLQGHETELELFLIGKNLSYQTLINIVTNNIKYFNNNDNSKLELENEQLKLMLEMKTTNNDNVLIQELIKTIKDLSHKVDVIEKSNKEILNKLNSHEPKLVTGFSEPMLTVGPRLQKINPETMMLIKVYESVSEVMKEDSNIKRPSVNKAIVENTIYCGYRWLLVDRELDPNIIHNITPTKQTKAQNLGYIAQINKEQTKIINVFLDRKTAAHFNGYESISALDIPVKKFTLSQGYYYKIYTDCDLMFREEFEEKINGLPLLYKNGVGQYDLQNNLIREFACKYDCIKTLLMSDKTLSKALTKNVPYNGFYFKEIGSKLKCV